MDSKEQDSFSPIDKRKIQECRNMILKSANKTKGYIKNKLSSGVDFFSSFDLNK